MSINPMQRAHAAPRCTLRQRPGFQSNAFEVVGAAVQYHQ